MTVVITSTTNKNNGEEVTIRVEGYLSKEDAGELRRAVEEARTLIQLDLSGLRGFVREAVERAGPFASTSPPHRGRWMPCFFMR